MTYIVSSGTLNPTIPYYVPIINISNFNKLQHYHQALHRYVLFGFVVKCTCCFDCVVFGSNFICMHEFGLVLLF